ncbi:hypothetical protein E2C01_077842 [Portunus trituberculatus]|uniref:Uncharacterized protein n=1 Tax=Portunus trituberculatus TaxID=210409 RepID=A0A5B7IN32_PORTR|nr:hypothetical protein [Portunus trituberculatus]
MDPDNMLRECTGYEEIVLEEFRFPTQLSGKGKALSIVGCQSGVHLPMNVIRSGMAVNLTPPFRFP